ncbi:MAG: hypothetical protein DHS20C15_28660 [Planctomycetota bacterium]|nr:MAG: hypothetical protein DHS20C15_28660 [Planctomycetota bacterium]
MSAPHLFARLSLALLLGGSLSAQDGAAEAERYAYVRMVTSLGDLVLELDQEQAPITSENFLAYVNEGFYDGTIFHRVISEFMAQGGGYLPGIEVKPPTRSPIRNESDNGLSNEAGTLAMARTGNPHSATSQFFINLVSNPNLDHPGGENWGYAVFGKVIDGFDTVLAIKQARVELDPRADRTQPASPLTPIVIQSATQVGPETCRAAISEARRVEATPPLDEDFQDEVRAAAADQSDEVAALLTVLGHDPEAITYSGTGLGSIVVREGSGGQPTRADTVTAHYTGWLLNGKPFDSSRARGEAMDFPLNRVIPAWTEGVSEMKVGERRILIAPPNLAYGPRGASGVIPPNSTLIFDVELLAFEKAKDYSDMNAGKALLVEKGVAISSGQTTASGLFYVDEVVGDGQLPLRTDRVTTHYAGFLTDGTQFDSSIERGTPATFPVSGVIAGWTEALLSMPVGTTRWVVIPWNLAYGAAGRAPMIPPKAALVFEMRLLEIK